MVGVEVAVGVGMTNDVDVGLEVGVGVGLGADIGVAGGMDAGLEAGVGVGVTSGIGMVAAGLGGVHAANNTAAKARGTIQHDPITMAFMVASPEPRRKPRSPPGVFGGNNRMSVSEVGPRSCGDKTVTTLLGVATDVNVCGLPRL